MKSMQYLSLTSTAILMLLCSSQLHAAVFIGDPNPGGIKYHLNFDFDNPGALSVKTGDVLPTIGIEGDRQDFNNDSQVDEVAVKAWRLPLSPSGAPTDDYGWSLNSRWSVVDLNGLAANGYTHAIVSITLQSDTTVLEGNGEHLHNLIPALTAWKGVENSGTQGPPNNTWYPNGSSSDNWSDWWASDLKQSAQNGQVWWAADDSNNPTNVVTLNLPVMALNGSSDLISLVFAGNRYDHPSQFNFANFKATVSVQAVPVPAAIWLFGSALAGICVLRKRKYGI
jgi:hypothetical protein